MRKLFWCCCLGMVAASAGIYMVSQHDHQHSGRSLMHGIGQAVTRHVGGAGLAMSSGETWSGAHCETAPPQIIEVSPLSCGVEIYAPETVVVPACLEECEVTPMPPCKDEECEQCDEVKKEEDGCMAEFWMNLFKDLMKDKEQEVAKPASEESDSVNQGEPADCQEDKDYHHRYPGCPYMGGCPRSTCPPPVTTEVKQEETTEPAEEIAEPREVPEEVTPDHSDVDTMEFRPSDDPAGPFSPGAIVAFYFSFCR